MKLRYLFVGISALMLCSCGGGGDHVIFNPLRLLLFVDTTLSLNTDQAGETADLARMLLRGDRTYQSVAVYPIGSADEAPVPVFDEAVKERVSQRRTQLQEWNMLLAATFRKHKGDAHTCILNSVEFASRQLAAARLSGNTPVDLVFITDMIEDCPSTPFGGPVRLDKPTIKHEIEQARHFPKGNIRLPNAHVFIVAPAGYNPGSRAPRIADLEEFWRTFFSRCVENNGAPELMISRSTLPSGLKGD